MRIAYQQFERIMFWLWDHMTTLSRGVRGERLAANYLRRQGYRVLGRNLRSRVGEIDILAEAPDKHTVVLVEVKTGVPSQKRDDATDGLSPTAPEMRVGRRKQRKLVTLASQMARQHGFTQRPIRFDVIGVDLPANAAPVIRHYKAAFESHV